MASTTSNTDLVPKEALDELKALDAQAAKVTKTLEGLLTPVSKLVNELSKTSGSFKALAESEKQLESYTKRYTEAVNEQTRIERQKAQLQQRLADLQSKEAQEVANLRLQIQMKNSELKKEAQLQMQTAKAAQQAAETAKAALEAEKQAVIAVTAAKESYAAASTRAARTTDELAATVSRVSGYGDLSSYIERSEQGLVNYSTAVNVATSRLAEIGSLQAEYKAALDAGNISQEEYNAKMEQLNAANEQTRASLETVRSEASATGSALQGAAAAAEQAFGELDVRIQEQSKNLVELQLEQQNIRNAIAELDAAYKNHAVTEEEYITRKAQLQALSDSQAVAVKNLTKQIELETTVATTAAGSYANLSAQYSLLKMQINQVGEAEGANVESKRKLEAQAKALYEQMSNLQKATGKHQLDVGKYDIAVRSLTQTISVINPSLGEMSTKLTNIKAIKSSLAGVTNKVSQALQAFGVSAKAAGIAASALTGGIGLLLAALPAIISGINKWIDKQNRLKVSLSETDEYAKVVANIQSLRMQWEALGDDMEAKKKFLKDHADSFNEIGEGIDTVTEAEKVLKTNTSDYLQAMEARIKANLLMAKATELIQKKMKMQEEYENGPGFWKGLGIKTASVLTLGLYDMESWRAGKAEDISQAEKDIQTLFQQSNEETKRYTDGLKELGITTDKVSSQAKRMAEALKKIQSDEAKANRELQTLLLKAEADTNKNVFDDEKASFAERREALNGFIAAQMELVKHNADEQINTLIEQRAKELNVDAKNKDVRAGLEKQLANQIIVIKQKLAGEVIKIDRDTAKIANEIAKQEADEKIRQMEKEISHRNNAIGEMEAIQLKTAAKIYKDGIYSAEEYEARKTEIANNAEADRFQTQIDILDQQLQEMVTSGKYSEQELQDVRDKIAKAGTDYRVWLYRQEVSEAEKAVKKKEYIEKIYADKKKELIKAVFDFARTLSDNLFDSQLSQLDEESNANQRWADEERDRIEELEESGVISREQADARKAAVDAKEKEREDELEKKRAEVKKKQAIFEKALTIAQIIQQTAQAIFKIQAEAAAAAAIPFIGAALSAKALSMIPWVIASAAVQTATVLATPIPEYALGTKSHPGGLAVVGDGGRPEVVMTPSGGLFRTPANDTLVDLPARSVVFPSVEEAMKNLDLFVPSVADAINSLDPLPRVDGRPDNRMIVNLDLKPMVEMQSKNNRILNEILFGVNRDRANRRFYTLRANIRHTKTSN